MGCAPQSRAPAPPEVSGPLGPAAKPNPRACPSLDEPLPECASPELAHSHCDSRKPPARTGASCRPRAAWRKPPAQTRASRRPRAASRKPPAQTGTSRRPRAAWRKPPARTGTSRRPRAASRKPPAQTGAGCGHPPTRSFGSPQGEKIAKPHIDLRHRLRIHDSGDVDDPFARYGPRLLGHGVRRTTQNELRPPPPQSNPPHGRLRTGDAAPMRRKADAPRRRRHATSIYGTKPSRLWFSAKCRQITSTAHPLSGPIRSELGPKVTGLPRPRC